METDSATQQIIYVQSISELISFVLKQTVIFV